MVIHSYKQVVLNVLRANFRLNCAFDWFWSLTTPVRIDEATSCGHTPVRCKSYTLAKYPFLLLISVICLQYTVECFQKVKLFWLNFNIFESCWTGQEHHMQYFPRIHAYILYLFCCCYMIIHNRFFPSLYPIHSEIPNQYWNKRMIMIAQVLVYFELTSKSIDIKLKQT